MRILAAFVAILCWNPGITAAAQEDQTAAFLREQAQLHPDSFEANHSLGEYLISKNQLRAAIPYLQKAHSLQPEHYETGYDLALACFEVGDTAESRRVIDSLLQRQNRAELHNLLADVEEKEGHVQKAAEQYEMAARMDPSEKNLFDLGSDLLLHQGFEAALTVFGYATQRYSQSAKLWVGYGVARYGSGQYEGAIEALCRGIDLDPRDSRGFEFLGKMFDAAPSLADEVEKRLSLFAQEFPNNAAANYYYALSLRRRVAAGGSTDRNERAKALLQRAVGIDPRFTEAHFQLGLLYEDEGNDAKAIHEYELAAGLNPKFAKAHYRLARLYQKNNQRDQAQREFRTFEELKGRQ